MGADEAQVVGGYLFCVSTTLADSPTIAPNDAVASLRHTFGTQCAARGVPITTLRVLMGHASIATTMRYVTVTSEHLGDAIRKAFGQQVGNTSETKIAE